VPAFSHGKTCVSVSCHSQINCNVAPPARTFFFCSPWPLVLPPRLFYLKVGQKTWMPAKTGSPSAWNARGCPLRGH